MSPVRRPQRYPRHALVARIITVLLLQCSSGVYGFSVSKITVSNPNSQSSPSSLEASREVLPNNNNPLLSTTTSSSTTKSSLPLIRDDPWTVLSITQTSVLPPLAAFFSLCLVSAVAVVAWEDYGARNLWPSRRMIVESTNTISVTPTTTLEASLVSSRAMSRPQFGARTVHGLAYGKVQRLQTLAEQQQQLVEPSDTAVNNNNNNPLLPEIKSYNEIGQEHRDQRVARWRNNNNVVATTSSSSQQQQQDEIMQGAVQDLQQILRDILTLERLAADYQWNDMHTMIQSSISPKLEPAATILRRHLMQNNVPNNGDNSNNHQIGYEEVGFDWGSCAWRHCGALADAQEALDELDHLLGVLEPPECLFCLNVAERSLRDMLAAVPAEYHAGKGIPDYVPYQSVHASQDNDGGDEMDVLDQDYLKMLNELRNNNNDDANDDSDD